MRIEPCEDYCCAPGGCVDLQHLRIGSPVPLACFGIEVHEKVLGAPVHVEDDRLAQQEEKVRKEGAKMGVHH